VARRTSIVWAVLVALAVLFVLPAAAEARIEAAATIFSEPSDEIGDGRPHLYHDGNAYIPYSFDGNTLSMSVYAFGSGPSFSFSFSAPRGEALRPGRYLRSDGPHNGVPGMTVTGTGNSCGVDIGEFEVKELEVAPDGSLERARVLFIQGCDSISTDYVFGEIRVGPNPAQGPAEIYPRDIRWPANDLLESGIVVPVTLFAEHSAVGVTDAELVGDGMEHFRIRSDQCSGRTFALGEGCRIWVRFRPTADEGGAARLRISTGGGVLYEVPLEGYAFGGTTRITLESEPGDPVWDGRSVEFTPFDAQIFGRGSPSARASWCIGRGCPRRLHNFTRHRASASRSGPTRTPGTGTTPTTRIRGQRYTCRGRTAAASRAPGASPSGTCATPRACGSTEWRSTSSSAARVRREFCGDGSTTGCRAPNFRARPRTRTHRRSSAIPTRFRLSRARQTRIHPGSARARPRRPNRPWTRAGTNR
jgi:hypothetical protein